MGTIPTPCIPVFILLSCCLSWQCSRSPHPSATESQSTQADNAVQFWYGPEQYFGQLGEAQRWVNVLGNISGLGSIDSATYRLNQGGEYRLSLGVNLHRLALPGDFNVELAWDDLQPGKNELKVTAYPTDHVPISNSMILVVERGNFWPLPYSIDFSQVKSLQEVVQIVDGHWQLQEDGVRTVQRYYDRVLSIGDTSWVNYEASIRLTIHDFTPSRPGPPTYNVTHFGVAMRWRGHHADGRQPSRKWYPLGAQGEFLIKDNLDSCRWRILFDGGGEKPPEHSTKLNRLVLGRPLWIRTQVATLADGRTRYCFRQWMEGEPEPTEWDLEGLESNDYPSGALCLVPHNSDVTIHEVRVAPLPPASK